MDDWANKNSELVEAVYHHLDNIHNLLDYACRKCYNEAPQVGAFRCSFCDCKVQLNITTCDAKHPTTPNYCPVCGCEVKKDV